MSDAVSEEQWREITERGESMRTETVLIAGHDGDRIEAYLARPAAESGSRGGVVVIHHLPGYDRATKEVTRRFAEMGYDAICPNLYWREAPGAEPAEASAVIREQGGVPDEQVVGDIRGAAEHLRALRTSNQNVGVIGYCSGGRQAVLAATKLPLDAAVDCYGGGVLGTPPPGLNFTSLKDELPDLQCPLLGLFGNDDRFPTPELVDELDQILTDLGKPHEFHRYDGAAHAFFSSDRPSYRVEAATDGWQRIEGFFAVHLDA